MKRVNYYFLFIPLLLLSLQGQCQSGMSSVDTLTAYRAPLNVRLYSGEIKLTRQQGLEAMRENKRTINQWIAGTSISTMGFLSAGAGVGLAYIALKGETVTAEDITGKLVVYKVRDQVTLAAGLLSFVLGASLVQVGVDKKMEGIRRFNMTRRVKNQENVSLNFGLVGTDKIGFTIKLP